MEVKRWMSKKYKWIAAGVVGILVIGLGMFMMQPAEASLDEEEVRELIGSQFGGTISSVNKTLADGTSVFEIELLSDGGIYLIIVDAASGDILSLEQSIAREEVGSPGSTDEAEKLTVEEVKSLVKEEYGDEVVISSIDLVSEAQSEDSSYEVMMQEGAGESRLIINAVTGETISYSLVDEGEHPGASSNQNNETKGEPIGEAEAARIALSKVTGEVDDVDLEEKDGRLYYEVEVENDAEGYDAYVWIDALTGEVVNIIWED